MAVEGVARQGAVCGPGELAHGVVGRRKGRGRTERQEPLQNNQVHLTVSVVDGSRLSGEDTA